MDPFQSASNSATISFEPPKNLLFHLDDIISYCIYLCLYAIVLSLLSEAKGNLPSTIPLAAPLNVVSDIPLAIRPRRWGLRGWQVLLNLFRRHRFFNRTADHILNKLVFGRLGPS